MRTLVLCLTLAASTVLGQSPEDEIRGVLARQQAGWNRGDIRAFMDAYERSEAITFVGATISRGYERILARYIERYPDKAAMGELTYSGLEVKSLGPEFASVIGRYHLKRAKEAGGDATGLFTLICRKTPAGWKIIQDHTAN